LAAWALVPVVSHLGLGQDNGKLSDIHSGWLYVVDTQTGKSDSSVLVVDPSDGRIRKSYISGYRPDIALSPDGSRLYISFGKWNSATAMLEGLLDIYDTATGELVSEIDNPDIPFSTLAIYPTQLSMAASGRYLYMLKKHETREGRDLYVTAFDTTQGRFLRDHASLPGCDRAMLVPADQDLKVIVKCLDSAYVRAITLSDGEKPVKDDWSLVRGRNGEIERSWGALVQESGRDRVAMISKDGSGFSVDLRSKIVHPLGRVINDRTVVGVQRMLISRNGKSLYVAAGHEQAEWSVRFDRLIEVDASTLLPKESLNTILPFFSMTASPDGTRLYTVSPRPGAITVIDASNLHEVRRFSVGKTPILLLSSDAGDVAARKAVTQ